MALLHIIFGTVGHFLLFSEPQRGPGFFLGLMVYVIRTTRSNLDIWLGSMKQLNHVTAHTLLCLLSCHLHFQVDVLMTTRQLLTAHFFLLGRECIFSCGVLRQCTRLILRPWKPCTDWLRPEL